MLDTNAVVVICTRPESKRLPRKAFAKIAGVPAIEHILTRLKGFGGTVVLAVPTDCREYDYLFEKFSPPLDLLLYRGVSDSPLHRMAGAIFMLDGLRTKPTYVIRITHDDIIIDLQTVRELLEKMGEQKATYGCTPDIVEGAGVEIFTVEKLLKVAHDTEKPVEHISYFVKSLDPLKNITLQPREAIRRKYRLTLDYEADRLVLDIILGQVGPFASCDEICRYVDCHTYVMNWNHQPKLTVYTCAYNAEKWIERTISSVLMGQSGFYDYEYIVIDDGSTDKTSLEVSEFSYERNLKLIRHDENKGLASRCNEALAMARGKYVIRVDADDSIIADSLLTMVGELERTGAGIVYPNFNEIHDFGKDDMGYGRRNCAGSESHHAGCAMMDKRLINEVLFKEGLRHWDSLDLYNRIKDKFKIAYLERPLWYYRIRPDSMSRRRSVERDKALEEVNETVKAS